MPKDRGTPLGNQFPGLYLLKDQSVRAVVPKSRAVRRQEKIFRNSNPGLAIAEAMEWRKRAIQTYTKPRIVSPQTLGETIERLESYYQTKSTYRDIKRYWKRILKHFGSTCPLSMITRDEVEVFRNSLRFRKNQGLRGEKKLTPSTIDRHVEALSSLLHLAHDRGWVEDVPKFTYYNQPGRRNMKLTRETFKATLAKLPPSHRAMCLMALNTGMRWSDVSTMRWSDLDMRKKLITRFGSKKTNQDNLSIPMMEDLHRALQQLPQTGIGLCFPSNRLGSGPRRTINKQLKAAQKEAGVEPWTFHNIRSLAVVIMCHLTGDPVLVSKLTGMTLANVQRYYRESVLAHEAIQKMNEFMAL